MLYFTRVYPYSPWQDEEKQQTRFLLSSPAKCFLDARCNNTCRSCPAHLLLLSPIILPVYFLFFIFLFFSFLWLTNKNLKVRFCCSITAAEQHDQIVYVLYSNSIWSLCFHTLKNKIAAEILYLRSSLRVSARIFPEK